MLGPGHVSTGQIAPGQYQGLSRGYNRGSCLAKESRKTRDSIKWITAMGKRIWLGLTMPSQMAPTQVTLRMALKPIRMEDPGRGSREQTNHVLLPWGHI